MGSPQSLREVRVIVKTGMSNSYVNAAKDAWNTTNATKYRPFSVDLSGLVKPGIEDTSLQTRKHAKPAPIPGLAAGTAQFSVPFGGVGSIIDSTDGAVTLLKASIGSHESPGLARSGVTVGTSTASNIAINAANFNVKAGQAILVGVAGDGAGEGEVKVAQAIDGVNGILIRPACLSAPAAGTALVCSTTVYFNEDATQQYVDTLFLGHATADQRQTIGGVVQVGVSSMGLGELPQVDCEVMSADNRLVPANERATGMDHDAAPTGGDPPVGGVGLLHVADYSGTERTRRAGGSFALETGITYEPKPNPAGPNGIGDWCRLPGVPRFTVNLLTDEDEPGLDADAAAKTNKTLLYQMGRTSRCVAIEMAKCHLVDRPVEATEGSLSAVACTFEGDEQYVEGDALNSAVMRFHVFD
ncbi:MAG: hypothetical protein ACYTEQ_18300 [Planctomycetota bacterium]|jgi:hypothetical protein